MNVGNIAQLASSMSNQKIVSEVSVAVANIANNQVKANGQAALQLIESVPKPQGSLGNHINTNV